MDFDTTIDAYEFTTDDLEDWGDMEPWEPFSEPGEYEAYLIQEAAYDQRMIDQQEAIFHGLRIA